MTMRCSAYRPGTGSSRGHAATSAARDGDDVVEVLVEERARIAGLLRLAHAGVLGAVHAQHRARRAQLAVELHPELARAEMQPALLRDEQVGPSGPASTVNRRPSAWTRKTGPSRRYCCVRNAPTSPAMANASPTRGRPGAAGGAGEGSACVISKYDTITAAAHAPPSRRPQGACRRARTSDGRWCRRGRARGAGTLRRRRLPARQSSPDGSAWRPAGLQESAPFHGADS